MSGSPSRSVALRPSPRRLRRCVARFICDSDENGLKGQRTISGQLHQSSCCLPRGQAKHISICLEPRQPRSAPALCLFRDKALPAFDIIPVRHGLDPCGRQITVAAASYKWSLERPNSRRKRRPRRKGQQTVLILSLAPTEMPPSHPRAPVESISPDQR